MRTHLRPWLVGLIASFVLGTVLGAAGVSRGAFGRADIAAQQALLEFLTEHATIVQGELNGLAGPHLILEGINVHLRSGSGATADGTLDDMSQPTGLPPIGLGNLVLGYDEEPTAPPLAPGDRGGSHNLVVGRRHRFASVGGLVVGNTNTIRGFFSSVSGGAANTASGYSASVSGGLLNTASGDTCSVSGGRENTASALFASVSGGTFNTASGAGASVSGGSDNTAGGGAASVSGGFQRTAPNINNWAGGGLLQTN